MKRHLLFALLAITAMLFSGKASAQLLTTSSGTRLWGNVIYCQSWADNDNITSDEWPVGIYSFHPVAPSVTYAQYTDKRLNANGGGFYRDGKFCFFNYQNLVLASYLTYYEVDMTKKEFTMTVENVEDKSLRATDMTYDRTTGNVYGQFYRQELGGRCIGVLNLDKMIHSNIVNTTIDYVALAADKDGKLYGISFEGDLYIIDKTTGEQTKIGATGVTPGEYRMSATFDWTTNVLYWACVHNDEDGTSALYTVDTTTGKATKVMDFRDKEQIVGMYTLPPVAEDGAPAKIADLACKFQDAATTGTISFTAPSKTFGGAELTGEVSYTVLDGDKEILTGTAQAATAVSRDITLSQGAHNITAYTKNDVGKSEDASISLWVGNDNPMPVADVKVSTEEGATATKVHISWTAPEKGAHDGYMDATDLKYDVVRMPGNKKIATATAECSVDDELDETAELQAYTYVVTAKCNGLSSVPVTSEPVSAGSAKDIPYTASLKDAAEMSLFTIVNANDDDKTWYYDDAEKAACYRFSVINTADDWLITPPLRLYAGKKYKLEFSTKCGASYSPENIEAAMGKGEDPAMYQNILKNTEIDNTDYKTLNSNFEVAEDGTYRIGLHAVSPSYRFKLFVKDISITLDNTSGINALNVGNESGKKYYDLTGRRVSTPKNGVYISDGKKFVK